MSSLGLAAWFGSAMLDQSRASGAAAGAIQGTVVDADTLVPLDGIQVRLYRSGQTTSSARTTDGSGAYEFAGLADGAYELWFRNLTGSGHASEWFDESADRSGGQAVTVAGGVVTVDESLSAPPPPLAKAVISGTVVSEATGAPLAGMQVRAYAAPDYTTSAAVSTDAQGRYAFPPKPAGDYKLWFRNVTGGTYRSEYHQDAAALGGAVAIELRGSDRTVDAALAPIGFPCTGATIRWDGSAGTPAWSTASNWDLDRVPTAADRVCIPYVVDAVVAPTVRPRVTSIESAGHLTLPGGIEVTGTSTASLLSDTTWTGGTISGRVEVRAGATVDDGGVASYRSSSGLLNRGTLRISSGGTLVVGCSLGSRSGLDNAGAIELLGDAAAINGSGATNCTPALWNRSSGVVRKVSGSGTGVLGLAVVNEGSVVSSSGTLALRGGSVVTNWSGATSGPGSGTLDGAASGSFGGLGSGKVEFSTPGPFSADRRTFVLGSSAVLSGRVDVVNVVTLTGTTASLSSGAVVEVLSAATLDVALSGGTINQRGGLWSADILPGELTPDPADPTSVIDRSRRLYGGSLGTLTIQTGATVSIASGSYAAGGSIITNEGTVHWPADRLYFSCDDCTFRNALGGIVEIERTGGAWGRQRVLVDRGTFDNDGLIRFTGAFPGVELAFGRAVQVQDYGMAQQDLTVPTWVTDLQSSGAAASLATAATGNQALAGLLRDAVSLALDDLVFGSCTNVNVNVAIGQVSASVCTVTDGEGDDAVSISFGSGLSYSFGSSTFAGLTIEQGGLVGYGVGTATVGIEDMAGLSVCGGGSVSVAFFGVTGSHCTGRQDGAPYHLDPRLSAGEGVHTAFGGISFSTDAADATVSASVSYGIVIPCETWAVVNGQACPVPPRITSLSSSSGYARGGTSLTIYGDHLEGATSVVFEAGNPSNPQWRQAAVITTRSAGAVVVTVPATYILGDVRVIVTTQRGGSSETRTRPVDRTYTYVPNPPPPDP